MSELSIQVLGERFPQYKAVFSAVGELADIIRAHAGMPTRLATHLTQADLGLVHGFLENSTVQAAMKGNPLFEAMGKLFRDEGPRLYRQLT